MDEALDDDIIMFMTAHHMADDLQRNQGARGGWTLASH